MNLRTFDKLKLRDFENGAVIDSIRKVYIALEEHAKYNPIRNDKEAYLYYMYDWAINGHERPNPKDYGLEVPKWDQYYY